MRRPYWVDQYRRYLVALEGFVSHMDESLPLTVEQRQALRSNPLHELDFGVGVERLEESTEVFPAVLRRSAFLLLFTLLEAALRALAVEAQRRSANPIAVADLRGTGITPTVRYIELVAGIRIRGFAAWSDIQKYQRLRNLLLHANGRIGAHDELLRWGQATGRLQFDSVDDMFVVQLHAGFCEHACDRVEALLAAIPDDAWPSIL